MVFAHALVALAFGHASMMLPVPRNANDQDLPMVRRNSTTFFPCRVGPTRILIFAISFLFLSLHSFVEANHQQHPALARTASAERMARAKVAIWERSRSIVVSTNQGTVHRVDGMAVVGVNAHVNFGEGKRREQKHRVVI